MPIDYTAIIGFEDRNQKFRYTDREVMLYALGVGFGRNPLDIRELRFVYEKQLKTLPSFASVMAHGCFKVRQMGISFHKVLHGEFHVDFIRPLPAKADLLVDVTVSGVWDKGADKGAVLSLEAEVRDASDGKPLSRIRTVYFCRGDGGFLKPDEREINEAPTPHALPERGPDRVVESPTREDQALLYRLSGDRNPLHADPDEARRVGFRKPILHGLCTYGICCGAILKTYCDFDPAKMLSLGVRFSQPVYPGEILVTEMWREGETVSFRARVKERNVVVVNNGYCKIAN